MSYESFWLLHRKLSPRMAKAVRIVGAISGREEGGYLKLPPMRNGRGCTGEF